MAPSPCMTCGRRPKVPGKHRCVRCLDKLADIGTRVEASARRLAMVPEPMRLKVVSKKHWPPGERWCAACQSFVDLDDCRGSRCVPCSSAATHGAMIEKTYGLTSEGYAALLQLQGGRCAICGNRPGKKKRFAVDHDHKTGEVRGLLCSTCNHDLLGAGYDSKAKLWSAYAYLDTPPASGLWVDIAHQVLPVRSEIAQRPADALEFTTPGESAKAKAKTPDAPSGLESALCDNPTHMALVGSSRDDTGFYRIYAAANDKRPPF